MPAVTSTIVALGGIGLSAAQAIKGQQQMQQASKAAAQAASELKNIKEVNPFKQVQVPTLGFNLAQQSKAQGTAQALQSLQGAGAEGVIGGVGNIVQAGNEQDLQLADLGQEAQFKRDAMQAELESGIQARKAERDFSIGAYQLEGAQAARAAAQTQRDSAIAGMFGSAGSALTSGSDLLALHNGKMLSQAEFNKNFESFTPEQKKLFGPDFNPNNLTQQEYMDLAKKANVGQKNLMLKPR
jgi:S-formylglutathione hydrolase FrmB